jgi:hypothetical protein
VNLCAEKTTLSERLGGIARTIDKRGVFINHKELKMKKTMSIVAIALMMAGSSAFACSGCGCQDKKSDKKEKKECCKSEEKKTACSGAQKCEKQETEKSA